jgi:hypothetical protein
MRIIIRVIAVLGLLVAASSRAGSIPSGWDMVHPVGGRCWTLMPAHPQPDPGRPNFCASAGATGQIYRLGFEDQSSLGQDGTPLLEASSDAIILAGAGKLITRSYAQLYGFPLCEFKWASGSGRMETVHLVLVKRRLYVLACDESGQPGDDQLERLFFSTIHFLRPNANKGRP